MTRKSIRNFCVLMPMLVPLGSFGDPYGDRPGEPYGDTIGERPVAGETRRGDCSGDMFSMSFIISRSCSLAILRKYSSLVTSSKN